MKQTKEIKQCTFLLDTKAIKDDGYIKGYASVFDNVDLGGDIVAKGAFAKTIGGRDPGDVKVLLQHNHLQPIGKAISLIEDNYGLLVEAKLTMGVKNAQEALALMKDGVINTLSIGYSVVKSEWDEEDSIRTLKEVDLWEVSPVTWAMNPKAAILDAKQLNDVIGSLKKAKTAREVEGMLREANISKDLASYLAGRLRLDSMREAESLKEIPNILKEIHNTIRRKTNG